MSQKRPNAEISPEIDSKVHFEVPNGDSLGPANKVKERLELLEGLGKTFCPECYFKPGREITGKDVERLFFAGQLVRIAKLRGFNALAGFYELLMYAGERGARFNEPWPEPPLGSETKRLDSVRRTMAGKRLFEKASKNLGIRFCEQHQEQFDESKGRRRSVRAKGGKTFDRAIDQTPAK